MPSSDATTATSSFLTPFLDSPQILSPPPRQEADNYLDVHGHYNGGKKHPKKKDRQLYLRRGETEGQTPERHLSILRPKSVVVSSGVCEGSGPGNSASKASPSKPDKYLTLQTDTHSFGNASQPVIANISSKPPSGPSPMNVDKLDSPATNVLRRLSQQQPTSTNSNSPILRRMSTALSNAFTFSNSITSSIDGRPAGDSFSQKRSRSTRKRSRGKSSAHRHGFTQENRTPDRLRTPTSITVRRASHVHVPNLPRSSMSASLSHEDERICVPDAPTSELLAFYSNTAEKKVRLASSGTVYPDTSIPSANLDWGESTAAAEIDSPRKPLSAAPLSPSVRRHSVLAANTITFADVHVAPGTFAVDQKASKPSLAAAGQPPRRISVVQFRSRDSVHEVVWREDETSSGSSLASTSRTSSSPRHQGPVLGSVASSPEGKTSPPKQEQHDSAQIVPVLSVMADNPQDLFQWSWTKPAVSSGDAEVEQENERKNRRPNLLRMTSASNPELTRRRRSSCVLNTHRRSVSGNRDILSFPPLPDRRSTLEWRRAPLVSVNDPLAGRTMPCATQEGTSSTSIKSGTLGSGGMIGQEEEVTEYPIILTQSLSGKRVKYRPNAHPGMGLDGRMGSCLGISSHKRVSPSVNIN